MSVVDKLTKDLCEACEKGDLNLVKKIINDGANPAAEIHENIGWDAYTYSPIHYALGMKGNGKLNVPLVEYLLSKGANINAEKCESGWMTRGSDSESGFSRILKLVISGKAESSLLALCFKYGVNVTKLIKSSTSTMRTSGTSEYFLIHDIVSKNRHDILKIILDNGGDPNSLYKCITNNEYGFAENTTMTPLHILIEKKPFDYFSETLLMEKGAKLINKKFLDQVEIEKPDYAKNVDDPRNNNYHSGLETYMCEVTPYQLAITMENIPALLFLQAYGCDKSTKYLRGRGRSNEKPLTISELSEFYKESFNNKLLNIAMRGKWVPELNTFYPKAFRVILKTLLLCFNRQGQHPHIPKEIIYTIFGFLSQFPLSYNLLLMYPEELKQ